MEWRGRLGDGVRRAEGALKERTLRWAGGLVGGVVMVKVACDEADGMCTG